MTDRYAPWCEDAHDAYCEAEAEAPPTDDDVREALRETLDGWPHADEPTPTELAHAVARGFGPLTWHRYDHRQRAELVCLAAETLATEAGVWTPHAA